MDTAIFYLTSIFQHWSDMHLFFMTPSSGHMAHPVWFDSLVNLGMAELAVDSRTWDLHRYKLTPVFERHIHNQNKTHATCNKVLQDPGQSPKPVLTGAKL